MRTPTATTSPGAATSAVRIGATLMAVAAAGFIGYAVLFLVRNFTDSSGRPAVGAGPPWIEPAVRGSGGLARGR